jgi:large subunit ribosomal protein L22
MATRQRAKSERIAKTRDKRPMAIARYIRIPSGKIEIVLDLIRGKMYDEAVAILNNTNKSASPVILKLLNSAAANAENNLNLNKDNLYVAECMSMTGPTMKRMMPRARGRADRILKRTAHIKIILDEKEIKKEVKKPAKSQTKPKEVPSTTAERPLTDKPNAKKPLGEKKVAPAKPAAKPAAKKTEVKHGSKS